MNDRCCIAIFVMLKFIFMQDIENMQHSYYPYIGVLRSIVPVIQRLECYQKINGGNDSSFFTTQRLRGLSCIYLQHCCILLT